MLRFELLQPEYTFPGPRLGRLYVPDGELKTPLCVGMTSRGVIPHLSFDLVEAHTSIRILYMTMEDCKCRLLSIITGRYLTFLSKLLATDEILLPWLQHLTSPS